MTPKNWDPRVMTLSTTPELDLLKWDPDHWKESDPYEESDPLRELDPYKESDPFRELDPYEESDLWTQNFLQAEDAIRYTIDA